VNTVWQLFKPEASLAETLSRALKIYPLIAQVLINRGIKSVEEADVFLNSRLAHLRDPLEIPNIVQAARRVLLAKEKGEKVLVFGDYDVDGVTGTSILLHTLKLLGIQASYYIPHRYGEGYSLSLESVGKIAQSGVKLVVTVDCGISNHAEIEKANSLGLDVVVTDHHNLPKDLPPAYAVVNPKLIPGEHPSRHLSGAGVAFKFAWALLRVSGVKDSVFLTSLLDLASLGTISDVVPLTAENRILAVGGLKLINERKRLGIKHLADAASLYGKISVKNIYFGLAPRINAAGRLEHASKSVELLLTDDAGQAKALAEELNQINVRRRGIGSEIKEDVFSRLSEDYIAENKVVVLSGENWHPGVIGIVASQVVDRYSRPAILVGVNEGIGRGSARSVEGLNIFKLLDSCRDLFSDFGGHEGAAGFEISPENIPELKSKLRKEVDKFISLDDLRPKIAIDAELAPSKISMSFIKELEVFDPHGEGNPLPVFMSRNLKLYDMRKVGSTKRHLKAKFTDGEVTLDTIGFDMGSYAEQLSYDNSYDIAYKLETNEWDGFEVAQLSLIDVREAK
jgi:single-stranded-DNA-specific exonuclease